MTLFIAEDEKSIRENLKLVFQKEGFTIQVFPNGAELLEVLKFSTPNLCILDILMPKLDGIETLKRIRAAGNDIPVMFLTSKDDEFDRVMGLNLGADDYLCKPFSLLELKARVNVILRRYNKTKATEENAHETISSGYITMDLKTYNVTVSGNPIELTVTEFRILEAFIKNKNIVLTRDQLLDYAYPDDTYQTDRAIDCHIKRLRKKIGFEQIETIYGLGYKFLGA